MKRIWLLSVVLSGALFGLDLGFSFSSSVTPLGASSEDQQVAFDNGYKINFDSNGFVSSFTAEGGTNTLPWLEGNNSPFDAFDFSLDGFVRRSISTKIVNKNFWLMLAPNPTSGIVKPSSEGYDIYVSVYDMNTSKVISNTLHFGASRGDVSFPNIFKGFKVTQASKDAKVGFLMCADYGDDTASGTATVSTSTVVGSSTTTASGSASTKVYTIYPYSDCSGEVHACDWEGKGYRICYSTDNFAIRPNKFEIKNIPTTVKAGDEFNITIDALDFEGNPTKEYNETLYLDENKTVKINYKITKAGCDEGNLTLVANRDFKNGETNATFKYNNVGVINLTVTELLGSEFAKVDEDDTDPSRRLISSTTSSITIVPDHFTLSGGFKNYKNSNFTYISDINTTHYDMAALLDLNITAETKDNNITTNYRAGCYAQPVEVNISYGNVPSNLKKMILVETNTSTEQNVTIPAVVSMVIPPEGFSKEGEADLSFRVNFERNATTPINQFDLAIKDVNITDSNGSKGAINNLNQKATFRYGRIAVENVSGYGKELDTKFRYEYWSDDEGWVLNTDHNSKDFGDVNETKSYYDSNITLSVNHNIANGEEQVKISTTHALPFGTKIHLSIPSYLWYHPIAKPYKDPSSDNLDCLTHPCMSSAFEGTSKGWAGIGEDGTKYSESNRSVKFNALDVKEFKSKYQKLNW